VPLGVSRRVKLRVTRPLTGLDGTERVIVNGLQRVRQGSPVAPELVDPITELPIKK